MCKDILNRRNILITQNLNDISSFSQNIFLDFIPDEVVLKGITFINDYVAAGSGGFVLNSDLIHKRKMIFVPYQYLSTSSDGALTADLSTSVAQYISFNLVYQLNRPVNSIYNFNIIDVANVTQNISGDIGIYLEFIKYR